MSASETTGEAILLSYKIGGTLWQLGYRTLCSGSAQAWRCSAPVPLRVKECRLSPAVRQTLHAEPALRDAISGSPWQAGRDTSLKHGRTAQH